MNHPLAPMREFSERACRAASTDDTTFAAARRPVEIRYHLRDPVLHASCQPPFKAAAGYFSPHAGFSNLRRAWGLPCEEAEIGNCFNAECRKGAKIRRMHGIFGYTRRGKLFIFVGV